MVRAIRVSAGVLPTVVRADRTAPALAGTPASSEADALMRRVASRDANAFEIIYDAHHRIVFGIGLRLLGDPASAEDLTQAVFLKLWTRPATFEGGSFAAWIARVARNAALDVLRQRSTRRETEIPADIPVDGTLEDAVFAHLDADGVRDALLRLPASERVLIEMGFFGGLTHRGVAARTGVPLGTVKTRIRTGLHRLRHALQAGTSESRPLGHHHRRSATARNSAETR